MNEKWTIENLWAIATHFTVEEGGPWLEKIPKQAFGTADFHALRFNPTCEWDVVNGFRTFELPGDRDDDSELVRVPEHSVISDRRIESGDFGGLEQEHLPSAECAAESDDAGREGV